MFTWKHLILSWSTTGKWPHQRYITGSEVQRRAQVYLTPGDFHFPASVLPANRKQQMKEEGQRGREEGWAGPKEGWKCHQSDCSVGIHIPTCELLIVVLHKNRNSPLIISILWCSTHPWSPLVKLQHWEAARTVGSHIYIYIHYVCISVYRSALSGAIINLASASSGCFHGYQW